MLDTGSFPRANVVERVAMTIEGEDENYKDVVDDVTPEGNRHGTKVIDRILKNAPDASIISIRVLDASGATTISAVASGLKYAIDHTPSVNYINLSMAGKIGYNEPLKKLFDDATNKGITIVGAAGNANDDVSNWFPGNIESAVIIGACNESGIKINSSNYGDTVDWNTCETSTSFATAVTTGYLASHTNYENLWDDVAKVMNFGPFFDKNFQRIPISENNIEYDIPTNDDPIQATITWSNGYGTKTLVENYDYIISSYTDDNNYYIYIEGRNSFTGTVEYSVPKNSISLCKIEGIADKAYTGLSIQQNSLTVKYGNKVLTNNSDYKISYTNNKEPGTATITITGNGAWTGSVTRTFKIIDYRVDINDCTYSSIPLKIYYNKKAQEPDISISYKGSLLNKNTDYTIQYQNNINVGTAVISINGIGDYKGNHKITFEILEKEKENIDITEKNISITGIASSYTYTGKAIVPIVNVTYKSDSGNIQLTKDIDYTIVYSNNIDVPYSASAAQPTVQIIGKGRFKGTIKKYFYITPVSIESAMVSNLVSKVYDGTAQKQEPVVTFNNKKLTKGTDYSISYKNNINAGNATITIKGIRNFGDAKDCTFKINPLSIKGATVTNIKTKYVCTGKQIKPNVVVKLSTNTFDKVLSSSDYSIKYDKNIYGTGKITIAGKGNFTGSISKTFKITTDIKSVKINKTSIRIEKGKTVTLHAILNPTKPKDSSFKYGWKSWNPEIAKSTNNKIKGIKCGTTTVSVTVRGMTAKCKVTVYENPVKSVTLNKTNIKTKKGAKMQLKATINPSNATNKKVTWKSSNTKLATVSSTGKVTCKAKGTVTITVITANKKKQAKCKIIIK